MTNNRNLSYKFTYNEAYFKNTRDLSINRINKTVNLLGTVKKKLILDLGCGTGEGSLLLQSLGADVTCSDLANYSMSTCHKLKFESIRSDAHLLPFNDSVYDGVLFMDVIEHIPKELVILTLKEIKRVTKIDGRIAIHTMPTYFLEKLSSIYGILNKQHWRRWGAQGGHINTYTPWRLVNEIKLSGLEILNMEIGPYPINAPFSRIIRPISYYFKPLLGNDLWICCSPKKN